jgi:hypothetical protein
VAGTDFRALIIRGLSSGSPKSLLVLINSLVSSILVVRLGTGMGYWSLISQFVLASSLVFVASVVMHLLITRIVYKVHGI